MTSFFEELNDPAWMLELVPFTGLLVDEDDLEAAMKIGFRLEALGDPLRIKRRALSEDLDVGPEMNRGAALARLGALLEFRAGLAAREWLRVGLASAPDRGRQVGRQGVHDR